MSVLVSGLPVEFGVRPFDVPREVRFDFEKPHANTASIFFPRVEFAPDHYSGPTFLRDREYYVLSSMGMSSEDQRVPVFDFSLYLKPDDIRVPMFPIGYGEGSRPPSVRQSFGQGISTGAFLQATACQFLWAVANAHGRPVTQYSPQVLWGLLQPSHPDFNPLMTAGYWGVCLEVRTVPRDPFAPSTN